MALTKTSHVERGTFVLNADGTLAGAHQESLTTISEDGVVLSVKQEPAVPLDAATLAVVLPAQAALLAQIQAMTDKATADATAAATDKKQALDDAAAASAKQIADLTAANTTVIAGKDAMIAAMQKLAQEAAAASQKAMSDTQAAHQATVADLQKRVQDNAAAAASVPGLQAQIEALTARLAPVDQQGFAVLTAVQVRLGLLAAGITGAQVDAVIASIPDATQRATAATYWDYATEYHRDHPLIATLSAALGLTSAQIDAMWRAAANIG